VLSPDKKQLIVVLVVSANCLVTLTGTTGCTRRQKILFYSKDLKRHEIEHVVYVSVIYSSVTLRLTNDTATDSWQFKYELWRSTAAPITTSSAGKQLVTTFQSLTSPNNIIR